MKGKHIMLAIVIILAATCIGISVYLFHTYGYFNFPLFIAAWVIVVFGVLKYYNKPADLEESHH